MIRFVMPIILIAISLTVFFVFTNPIYKGIADLRTTEASYNEALGNSKALEDARDKLTFKYNSIDKADLAKLEKLLPESIDNIRLILEIEQIASPYGMVLKDIKYNATDKVDAASTAGGVRGTVDAMANKDYGVWDLEFSTTSSYNNFLNFTRDLEKNLRIVDISSIQFSSVATGGPVSAASADSYKYSFKIKTYWLKN